MDPTYAEFPLASTWVFELACVDPDGVPLNLVGGAVQLRVASEAVLVLDLHLLAEGVGFATGLANLVVAPSDQLAVVPGFYRYETRALLASGLIYPQRWGNLKVTPSLFEEFPYTPPELDTPGVLAFNRARRSGLITVL